MIRARSRASTAFVLVTLGLDALGTGLIAPIVPGLVRHLAHLPSSAAAPWVGALIAAYAGVQFLMAPLLGELSDRFGRRPVILASVCGLGLDNLLLVFAPNLWWLFLGRLVAGATSANVSAATAYIADVTPAEERSKQFGLIGATFGAGFVIGPALGGVLGAHGLRLPFLAAAILALLNALFGVFVLPESLDPEKRRPLDWKRANPFALLGMVLRDRSLGRIATAWSCSWIGLGAIQSTLVLFTAHRFGWGAERNGLLLAGVGLAQGVSEGLVLRPVVSRVGERWAAVAGYVFGAVGFAVLALAFAGWMVLPAVALMALGGLAMPSVKALGSGKRDEAHQGEMQGVFAAVEGMTAIFAPLLTAGLFDAAVSRGFPGAPFALAALAALVAGLMLRGMQS